MQFEKTNLTCPICGKRGLYKIKPPYYGWEYLCDNCKALVIPMEIIEETPITEDDKKRGVVGRIIAIPSPF